MHLLQKIRVVYNDYQNEERFNLLKRMARENETGR
jgi:hypothetical protein